jgi:hypothetical protein
MSDVESHEQLVERGRKIMAKVRALQAEDRARNEAFAATVESPNKKYEHRVDPAAEMVAAAIGAPYSGVTLRHSSCPYVLKSRIAFYAEDDLRKLAEDILNSAPVRRGRPLKRYRRKAPVAPTP